MFFGGNIENLKNTITELYQNLTSENLSVARETQIDWISDLVLYIPYKLQHSSLLKTEKKDPDTKKYNESVKEKYDFDEKPSVDDKFEEQIVMEMLNNAPYDHIKTEELYVEPTVQDAETIDEEMKQENEDYLKTAAEFNKIDMAATAQKKRLYNSLFDAVIDLHNSMQIIDDAPTTEDTFIDDNLFSEKDIEDDNRQIIDDILKDINYFDILMQYTPPEIDIKI